MLAHYVLMIALLFALLSNFMPRDVNAFDHKRKGERNQGTPSEAGHAKRKTNHRLDERLRGAFFARRYDLSAMIARGFYETGLRPAYPPNLSCPKANSFFGETTRGNGTLRSQRFYAGRHGGMDIPARDIPIIAVANGEVVEKSVGEGIGGIRVVLRHSPEDTGLDRWTFTEYKHLAQDSHLALNARVEKGQPIGIAGNTGTTSGRAYGPDGHYHLHLSAWYNATGKIIHTRRALVPDDGYWLDPLALMLGGPLASEALHHFSETEKKVRFAYMTEDGNTHPVGAKVVWPFVCR